MSRTGLPLAWRGNEGSVSGCDCDDWLDIEAPEVVAERLAPFFA